MWTDGWLNTLTLFAITFVALIYLLRKWFQADADELQWQIDSLKPNTTHSEFLYINNVQKRLLNCEFVNVHFVAKCQPVVEDGVPSLSIRS